MLPSQPKSRRRGGERSRSGCKSCKARHIKCDETRPNCRRCLIKGQVCGGYSTTIGVQQVGYSSLVSQITAYAIPFRIPGSQQDRRLFHYFCVRGADDLTGHLTSDFWTRLVLQYSHDHISVRQALVALSCAHQYYTTTEDITGSASTEATVNYSRAMRSLRKYMSAGIDQQSVSTLVPLICSVIFFSFENMQGNTESALRHLDSGIAILAHQREADSTSPNNRDHEEICLLEQMLTRLDLQASMFDDARLPLLRPTLRLESEVSAYQAFESLGNAQAELIGLQSGMLRFLMINNTFKFWSEHNLPDDVKLEKQAIEVAYTEWSRKFDQLLHAQSSRVRETLQDPAITILRIHYLTFRLLLSHSFPHDPAVFSGPSKSTSHHTLNEILDLIESITRARGAGSRSVGAEAGIIPPLFLVIAKCTDHAIFKRALDLLLSMSGSREGMFNSRVIAEIAMHFASQHQTPPGPVALEWQATDVFEERVNGLTGVARNLGIVP
ncbi:hypothetical protein F5B22DRAFT_470713 [Xylaria bambusicola]|uniref:uncharacterized protein n=1 Tax=Xylaria bambusicola TaxID=326684 RepID=UPI00200741F7|nr:uncharacterized protein F5B22DRAFT_470713 [Xylaria bambusicola]KAI0506201.1 hypothetical protein F5B22DRAFT_470713 [Xylaria bambusicola]